MTVVDDEELLREFRRLQIRQVEILELLVRPPATTSGVEPPQTRADRDTPRPLRVGDKVKILNAGGIRVRRDTVCTVIRVGARITSITPSGVKIVRAAHNLVRVQDYAGTSSS